MDETLIRALIARTTAAIADNADALTDLDRAIGDGDHGINMKRGFDAIAADADRLAAMPLGEAVMGAGMIVVKTVGGASGPLYGSLLMGMGKALKAGSGPAQAFAEGVAMVKKRGRAERGAKTMLDVLIPAAETLAAQPATSCARLRAVADEALEATRDMIATRGRASFLGERARGHLDPGAASSRLLIHAVCDALEEFS